MILVCGLAALFRLWRLEEIPPGIFIDEAVNGLDARAIAQGERFPVFLHADDLPAGRGREPMYHYLMATVSGGSLISMDAGPKALLVTMVGSVHGIDKVIGTMRNVRDEVKDLVR